MFVAMQKGDIKLIIVFVLFCMAITFRIAVNKNRYVTPDSKHYLRSAKNYNAGKGFTAPEVFPFRNAKEEVRLAMWPVGYSFCIAQTAQLSGLRVLWASKVVNLLFFGFTLLLLRKLFGSETWFVVLSFFSFSALEIYSFTWSEGPFIFCVVLFVFILLRWERLKLKWVYLAVCLAITFTIRYAGIIYYFQIGILAAFLIYRGSWRKSLPYIIGAGLASTFVILYLLYNKEHNGMITGMDRFARADETTGEYFSMLFQGLFNEFFIIRNYYFLNEPIGLFLITAIIQSGLIIFIFKNRKLGCKITLQRTQDKAAMILIGTGLFYLIGIIIIRFAIIFDPLNYRILSPASIPILMGLMALITTRKELYRRIKLPITVFFTLSLLLNLPKEYILGLIGL